MSGKTYPLLALLALLALMACSESQSSQPPSALPSKAPGPSAQVPERVFSPPEPQRLDRVYVDAVRAELERIGRTSGDLTLASFMSWAQLIDESASFQLRPQDSTLVRQLRERVSALQRQELPRLRREWTRQRRGSLRDVEMRSYGPAERYAEFFGPQFSASSSVTSFQDSHAEMLHQLRFSQVVYRWTSRRDEYVSYSLDVPADDQVVVWNRLSFRPAGNRSASWK